jgi:hypothetical protein
MNNSIISNLTNSLEGSVLQYNENANVGKTERIISVGTGAFIALKGITNLFSSPLLALAELTIGGGLLYRGVTGYCAVKEQIDRDDEGYNAVGNERIIATEAY